VTASIVLGRDQILAFRRRVNALDARLPWSGASLRTAAWAGLQDSIPRAALHSIHARVEGAAPDAWEDEAFVQVWGPRFAAYVVVAEDAPVFTLGRLPDDPAGLAWAEETADRLETLLAGRRMPFGDAGHALGVDPNFLRYATTTGRVRIRWDGARQSVVWTVPRPEMDSSTAATELLRRYLHLYGPGTPEGYLDWAGIRPRRGVATFAALAPALTRVTTPTGEGWILPEDEWRFREPAGDSAPVRLLPCGDAYTLVWGPDRELLVPDAVRRPQLWTGRVAPGAVLVRGEIAGVWRRSDEQVAIELWRQLGAAERDALGAEAQALPVPGLSRPISVTWAG
jgi:hypothetical protein